MIWRRTDPGRALPAGAASETPSLTAVDHQRALADLTAMLSRAGLLTAGSGAARIEGFCWLVFPNPPSAALFLLLAAGNFTADEHAVMDATWRYKLVPKVLPDNVTFAVAVGMPLSQIAEIATRVGTSLL